MARGVGHVPCMLALMACALWANGAGPFVGATGSGLHVRLDPVEVITPVDPGNVRDSSSSTSSLGADRHARALGDDEDNVTLTGIPEVAFSVEMSFGTPGQAFHVVVDTGSSNLAVASLPTAGAEQYFNTTQSSTFVDENTDFSVFYQVGQFSADRVSDVVAFTGVPQIANMTTFGAITSSDSFFRTSKFAEFDGILGMAYTSLAQPTADPIEPFFDAFVSNSGIDDVFTLQMCSVATNGTHFEPRPGVMTLGGVDNTLFHGDVRYSPLKQENFYTVSVTGIVVGNETLDLGCSAYNSPAPAKVDSGTTNLVVSPGVFRAMMDNSGIGFDNDATRESFENGRLCIRLTDEQLLKLPTIKFSLASDDAESQEFDLHMHAWQWLRPLDPDVIGGSGNLCRILSITQGCGTILGVAVLSGYVTVFDRTGNGRIGFATSTCAQQSATLPVTDITGIEAPRARSETSSCEPDPNSCKSSSMSLGVMLGIGFAAFAAAAILLAIGVCVWNQHRSKRKANNSTPI